MLPKVFGSVMIITLLVGTLFVGLISFNDDIAEEASGAQVITVDCNGGGDYDKIQDAINAVIEQRSIPFFTLAERSFSLFALGDFLDL